MNNAKLSDVQTWVNQQTGEVIETNTLEKMVSADDVDVGFHKIWIAHILETIEEVGNAKVKVLFWLLNNMDKNNMVKATTQQIADRSGVSIATAKRLMTSLRKADVVRLQYGGRWVMNPSVVFKGRHSRRMNVLIRYKNEDAQDNEVPSAHLEQKAA